MLYANVGEQDDLDYVNVRKILKDLSLMRKRKSGKSAENLIFFLKIV